ncbi:bile acid:sodium symporter family protein [Pseudomonas sp. EL_65y_Pfl2_R95]|uniref:bile acid:sodium symporter family protein n=1 Tax=Pseudomonas sp. EL_65y_Pfl2_R95 TaxID=3088698 RepID=UPI0030DAC778
MRALISLSRFVGNTFALWVLLFAVLAFMLPSVFLPLTAWIVPLLGLIMFGMGLTLKTEDFREVARRPVRVFAGVIAQFVIMPCLAWLLCKLLSLPPEIAVGVILVGCCPGGTASNVMTWFARGDVALSVAITAVTTLLAPLVTPALIWLLASAWLPVSFVAMFVSILKMVLLPIILGIVVQRLLGDRVKLAVDVLPLISVVSIVAIVAAVVAASQAKIAESGLLIMAVVILHNGIGLALGYLAGRMMGMPLAQRKTMSIEVGMQNSGLGAALASAHFSPLAAVPSALFSVWHNLSGPLVASIYRRMKDDAPDKGQ